ncbi:hypothetical protein E4U43_000777 [Claviceps pusilla]|uniref:Uncharacterized protein n=1 Tax=Claviceps pusilla TaxID=123648 RepID=A0A9P7SXE7_9HYPO|nr:hypothetical protein E4U43_000777 [Claviceps pusilla]
MRLLTVLALACGAVATAAGPQTPGADTPAIQDADTLELESAILAESHEPLKRDVEVELATRAFPAAGAAELYGIPFPVPGANDVTMTIFGVAITFMMGVRRLYNAANLPTPEYYIRAVRFWNRSGRDLQLRAMALGARWMQGYYENDYTDVEQIPAGANSFDFIIEGDLGPRCSAYEGP